MTKHLMAAALCVGTVCGCGPTPTHERFVGQWRVYDAYVCGGRNLDVVQLNDDGSIEPVFELLPPVQPALVTFVGPSSYIGGCDWGHDSCAIGDSWQSSDGELLTLSADCDDGLARTVQVQFDNDPGLNVDVASTSIVSVSRLSNRDVVAGARFERCEPGDCLPE